MKKTSGSILLTILLLSVAIPQPTLSEQCVTQNGATMCVFHSAESQGIPSGINVAGKANQSLISPQSMSLYAAQHAEGTGWRTELKFVNRVGTQTMVQYFVKDHNGNPISTTVALFDGTVIGTGSAGIVSLLPHQGTTLYLTASVGLQTGWISFTTTSSQLDGFSDMGIQESFINLDGNGNVISAVSVPVEALNSDYLGPAMIMKRLADHVLCPQDVCVDVGFAVANVRGENSPPSFTAHVQIQLWSGSTTSPVPIATTTLTLTSGQQQSLFLSQLVPNLPVDQLGNPLSDGSIRILSDQPISLMLLRMDVSSSGDERYSDLVAFTTKN